MDADRVVVGIDNGATKNNATVLDASGRFLVDRMHEIPSRVAQGPEAAIEAMAETMDLVLRDTGTDRVARRRRSGWTRPGPASAVGVISTRGATNFAQPAWWGFDVRGALEAHIGLPVVYNNDGNAAALYAHHVHFGADAPMHSSVSAVVGTGLGGGVIEAGLVVRGAAGMAGELGHVQIFTDGLLADDQPMPTCACGNSRRRREPRVADRDRAQPAPVLADPLPRASVGRPADRPGRQGGARLRRATATRWRSGCSTSRPPRSAASSRLPPTTATRASTSSAAAWSRRRRIFRDWFLDRVRAHTRLREEQAAIAELRARAGSRHGRRPRIGARSHTAMLKSGGATLRAMTAQVAPRPRVLADLVPGALARDVALVIGAAVLTGIVAQVSIPLPFTPVPVTLQTLTVLLAGAALGPMRGGLACSSTWSRAWPGCRGSAEQQSGWEFATFGYIIGFVARRRRWSAPLPDAAPIGPSLGAACLMVLGNLVIYVFGVAWLASWLGVDLPTALRTRRVAVPDRRCAEDRSGRRPAPRGMEAGRENGPPASLEATPARSGSPSRPR